jgi:hypothetical protein
MMCRKTKTNWDVKEKIGAEDRKQNQPFNVMVEGE